MNDQPGKAGDPGPDEPDRGLDVDQAFADIVARFGPAPDPGPASAEAEEPAQQDQPAELDEPAVLGETAARRDPEEDHFVPPPPPPLPAVEPRRKLAWAGLLGTPLLVLAFVVLGVPVGGWVGFLLGAAFVGGFGYLVATMRTGPPESGDDGAVL